MIKDIVFFFIVIESTIFSLNTNTRQFIFLFLKCLFFFVLFFFKKNSTVEKKNKTKKKHSLLNKFFFKYSLFSFLIRIDLCKQIRPSHWYDLESCNFFNYKFDYHFLILNEILLLQLYEDDMCLCILDTHPLSHG